MEAYISTADFKKYIQDGDRVKELVKGLYQHVMRTHDTSLFVRMIRYDNRDKKSSAAYFRALRQAVLDNEYDLSSSIFREIDFPVDLVADALQADSPVIFSEPGYFDPKEWNAWAMMIQDIKKKDPTFGQAFAAYQVMRSSNQQELIANIIAADDPEVLWLIQDLPEDVLMQYILWKYGKGRDGDSKLPQITMVLGRLPASEIKDTLYGYLHLHAQMTRDPAILRDVEDAKKRDWINYQEDDRRSTLGKIVEIISTGEQQGINTQSDVADKIIKPLTRAANTSQILRGIAIQVIGIVKERFRYLPDAR